MSPSSPPNGSPRNYDIYRTAFDTSQNGVVFFSPDGKVLDANEAVTKFTGLPRDEILRLHCARIIAAAGIKEQCPLRISLEQGSQHTEVFSAAGLEFAVVASPIRPADGGSPSAILVFHDLTERRNLERKSAEQERLYHTLLNSSPDAICITDRDGTILLANQAAAAMYGVADPVMMAGTHTLEYIAPHDRKRAAENMRRTDRAGRASGDQYDFLRKDGSTFPGEVSVNVVKDEEGSVVLRIGIIRSLERQREMEKALRRSEERFRHVADYAREWIWETDPDGTIVYSSAAVEEILLYQPSEIVGKKRIFDLVSIDHPEGAAPPPALGNSSVRDVTARAVRKDGKTVWLSFCATPFNNPDGSPAGFRGVATDITHYKEAFEALSESRELYRTLIETSPDAILVSDLEGRITMANRSAAEMAGLDSPDRLVGMDAFSFIAPEDRAAAYRNAEKILREDPIERVEYRAVRPDGSHFHIELCASLIRDHEGTPSGFMAIARDITERKRAEQALRESEALYSAVVNQAYDGVIIIQDGNVAFVNQAAAKASGYPPEKIIGTPFLDHIAPRDRDKVARFHRRRIEGGDAPSVYKAGILASDGSVFETEISTGIIQYRGKPAVVAIVRDLSERKRMEAALKESEAKYLALVYQARDAIIISQDDIIRFANQAAAEISGRPLEELIGTPLSELLHPEDRTVSTERRHGAEADALPSTYETRLIRKDGTERIVEISSTPITYDGKPAVISIGRDITERRKTEEELAKIQKIESLGLLAGGIAHDFNNILTAVLGNVSLALLHSEPGSPVFEKLEEASQAILRARHITQQLLTFSKGGAPLRTPLYIPDLLRETVGFALSGSNVSARFDVPEDLWPVEANEGQLAQVFHNIALNAVQAMPSGGTLFVSAANEPLPPTSGRSPARERTVRITFSDTGPGIPEQHIKHVMEPYFTTKEDGKGLGLAVAFSIIRAHGGDLSAASPPGKGAVFTIRLPATGSEPVLASSDEPLAEGTGRILLMDDEDLVRNTAAEMLRFLGYEVETAGDGEETLAMYKAAMESGAPFDAVILDLTVSGGMGGVEAVKKLAALNPGVKAVASSGYSTDPVMADCRRYGFSAVLAKPYRIADLGRILRSLLSP